VFRAVEAQALDKKTNRKVENLNTNEAQAQELDAILRQHGKTRYTEILAKLYLGNAYPKKVKQ
jgi:hypothetical protein